MPYLRIPRQRPRPAARHIAQNQIKLPANILLLRSLHHRTLHPLRIGMPPHPSLHLRQPLRTHIRRQHLCLRHPRSHHQRLPSRSSTTIPNPHSMIKPRRHSSRRNLRHQPRPIIHHRKRSLRHRSLHKHLALTMLLLIRLTNPQRSIPPISRHPPLHQPQRMPQPLRKRRHSTHESEPPASEPQPSSATPHSPSPQHAAPPPPGTAPRSHSTPHAPESDPYAAAETLPSAAPPPPAPPASAPASAATRAPAHPAQSATAALPSPAP